MRWPGKPPLPVLTERWEAGRAVGSLTRVAERPLVGPPSPASNAGLDGGVVHTCDADFQECSP